VINSGCEETEGDILSDARVKIFRLGELCDWQQKEMVICYRANRIKFSENSGPVESDRSASEAFKLYFVTSDMDALVTERTQYSSKFRHAQG
jgi:hypothetical protein